MRRPRTRPSCHATPIGRSKSPRRHPGGSWACTAWARGTPATGGCGRPRTASNPELRFARSVSQDADELIPVPSEVGHVARQLFRDLVDRHEECHLALTQRVEDLALPAHHAEDRLPVGDQLDLGEMLVESGFAIEEVPR